MPHDLLPSNDKPIIAVCGARGAQGSSVIQALLTDGIFAVRALTRLPVDSIEAEGLATLGAEVVQANYDEQDTLERAFEGCYGVFGITDFYEAGAAEVQQGKNIVDAAKAKGVKHMVWSSGPDTDGVVKNYDFKAEVGRYLVESGVPYTCILVPIYYDTVLILMDKHPTGGFIFKPGYPIDSLLPLTHPSDVGNWVAAVFLNPEDWINKTANPCNEWLSPRELGQIFSEIVGEECQVPPVTVDQFLTFEPVHESLHNLKNQLVHHMKYLLRSHEKQVWSDSIGRQLNQNPRLWRDICQEKAEADGEMMKSPVDGDILPQRKLSIQVTEDREEESM
ncbi:hypothetical protein FRC03_000909 [Tulasnella sp. 419]|nr:hypothetical protein FRC03_000909 [Tulasnella sp. 419]